MTTRLRLAVGRDVAHAKLLRDLRSIVLDEQPRGALSEPKPTYDADGTAHDPPQGSHEKQRKAGMVRLPEPCAAVPLCT